MSTFRPVSNYILVQTVEIENKTASGLVLPESSVEKPNIGSVRAVGEGQLTIEGVRLPMSVKEGDTVLFPKFAGTEVKLNGNKFLIMRDTDIFGVIE